MRALFLSLIVVVTYAKADLYRQSNQFVEWDAPLTTEESVQRYFNTIRDTAEGLQQQISAASTPTFDTVVEPFDLLLDTLFSGSTRLKISADLTLGTPSSDLATELSLKLDAMVESLYLDPIFAEKIKNVSTDSLPAEQKRLLEILIEAFEDSLPAGKNVSAEVKSLLEQVAELETEYDQHLSDTATTLLLTEDEVKGLSTEQLKMLQNRGTLYIADLSNWHEYEMLRTHLRSPVARLRVFRAWAGRATNRTKDIPDQIAAIRQRLAVLYGAPTWAWHRNEGMGPPHSRPRTIPFLEKHYPNLPFLSVFSRGTDGSTKALKRVSKASKKAFKREQREMLALLKSAGALAKDANQVGISDVAFAESLKRQQTMGISHEALSEYLPLSSVLKGLFTVTQQVFGVAVSAYESEELEGDENAQRYLLKDSHSGELLGALTMDLFPRKGKGKWFYAETLQTARKTEDGFRRPSAIIIANLKPSKDGKEPLLSMDDVETLFHEFGHVLHFVLPRTRYRSTAPNDASIGDLMELPSMLLENMAWDPEIIKLYAKHWKTGEPLSEKTIKSVSASHHVFPVHELRLGVAKSLADLALHSGPRQSAAEIERAVFNKHYYPLPKGLNLSETFSHLGGGYDAFYWTYLWSLGAALQGIDELRHPLAGIIHPVGGAHLRRNFLEQGSRKSSPELLSGTLQKPYDFCRALLSQNAT